MKKWLLAILVMATMLFTGCETGLKIKEQLTTNLFTTEEQEILKTYAEAQKTELSEYFDITYVVTSEKFEIKETCKKEYEGFVVGDTAQIRVIKTGGVFTFTLSKNGVPEVEKTNVSLVEVLKKGIIIPTIDANVARVYKFIFDPSKYGVTASNEVHLAGVMNDWNPSNLDYSLTKQADGTWTGEFAIPVGTAFKFMYDSKWTETIDFKVYETIGMIEKTDKVKFIFDPSKYGVTASNEVHLVGVMNDWNPLNLDYALTKQADETWVGTFTVSVGTEFKYMFDSTSWADEKNIGLQGLNGTNFVIVDNDTENKGNDVNNNNGNDGNDGNNTGNTWQVYNPSTHGYETVPCITETNDGVRTTYIKTSTGDKGVVIAQENIPTDTADVYLNKYNDINGNPYEEYYRDSTRGNIKAIRYNQYIYDFESNNYVQVPVLIEFGFNKESVYLYTNNTKGVLVRENDYVNGTGTEYDMTGTKLVSQYFRADNGLQDNWKSVYYMSSECIYMNNKFVNTLVIREYYGQNYDSKGQRVETYRKNSDGTKGTLAMIDKNGTITYYAEDGVTEVEFNLIAAVGTVAYTDAEFNTLKSLLESFFSSPGYQLVSCAKVGNTIEIEFKDNSIEIYRAVFVKTDSSYAINIYNEVGELIELMDEIDSFEELKAIFSPEPSPTKSLQRMM